MAPDVVPILIAIALLSALLVALRSWQAWQQIGRASRAVLDRAAQLEVDRMRTSFGAFRGKLGEGNVQIERGLWAVSRFDGQAHTLEGSLRARRAAIEDFHVRYLGPAGRGLERARGAASIVRQMLELRRTLLG
ncbi:MAG TPA: hypothetical protein VMP67_09440 [Candidatus Limnocylindria bacterium]|nr:hypothetical protein [Candidatus Limnocylindria bacterium]